MLNVLCVGSLVVLWYYLGHFLIWGVFVCDVSGFRSISGWEGVTWGCLSPFLAYLGLFLVLVLTRSRFCGYAESAS